MHHFHHFDGGHLTAVVILVLAIILAVRRRGEP